LESYKVGDAAFRADLIKALGSTQGWVAAEQAAEIMLRDATDVQIDEVRNLLPETLQAVVKSRSTPKVSSPG
jgi:hypothetical protein